VAAESQIDVAEDRSPARRLARIAVWIGGVAVPIWILDLLGIPVGEWIEELFDKLGEIPPATIVAAVILLVMFTVLFAGATFPMMLSGLVGILIGGLVLIALLGGTFRRRLAGLRSQVAGGGAVIRTPRRFLARPTRPPPPPTRSPNSW
jgi:hypothetical protein